MAIPKIDKEYEALKQEAKELIAAGGCHAISLWSRSDAERLCPDKHKKFEELEVPMYISDWIKEARKAIELIWAGIEMLTPYNDNKEDAPVQEKEISVWHKGEKLVPESKLLELQERISQLEQERKDIASDAWDAALKRKYCEMAMESNLWNRPEMPPDKTTYLTKFDQIKNNE